MSRSIWKVKNIYDFNKLKSNKIKIFNGNFLLTKEFENFVLFFYNGYKYNKMNVIRNNIGHYLKEFISSKKSKSNMHISKKKKKKK